VKATIFYSWQSDTPGAANRNLVLSALEAAAKEIAGDESINVEPAVDRDTQNVAGSPDIGGTILAKIRTADVVVADVTIINGKSTGGRLTPNPNVLIEVGYALAIHSESRLILVNNLALSRPEDLPFDLRQKRVLSYTSLPEESDRAADRRRLQSSLKLAISGVLTQHGVAPRSEYPVQLSMSYRVETQTGDLHEYVLQIKLQNVGSKRIDDWHVDVAVPTPLLRKASAHVGFVPERSNKDATLIRFRHESHNGSIYPGDSRLLLISYRMTHELYERRGQLLEQPVIARAYIQGVLGAEIKQPAANLQQF
jgi:hypothetical protein